MIRNYVGDKKSIEARSDDGFLDQWRAATAAGNGPDLVLYSSDRLGDMVRTGGLGYTIKVDEKMGRRIGNMTLLKTGEPIEPMRDYIVAGWASVQEGTQGPPVWELVGRHLQRRQTIGPVAPESVKVVRG